MKNSLRYIIREQIEKLLEAEEEMSPEEKIKNIQDKAKKDIESLNNSRKEMAAMVKYEKDKLNADKQVRGKTPTTVSVAGKDFPNPKRRALDQELPASEKVTKEKEKNLKDLDTREKEIQQKADAEIKDQMIDAKLQKSQKSGDSKSSVLPSMDSLI
jgi:hypothetical protein